MTTDLDDPVIIASITAAERRPPAPLLIDGMPPACTRPPGSAASTCPAFVLTAAETLSIRRPAILMPGHGPARRQARRRENQ